MVWLAQERTAELERRARAAAAAIGLPLTVLDVGLGGLESELALLIAAG